MEQRQEIEQHQYQRFEVQQTVLRVVEDFGSESALMLYSAIIAWIVQWPPDSINNLPFYQALTKVAPATLWSGCWWALAMLVLMALVVRNRSVRALAMALQTFSWFFTGVVLWSAATTASILSPFAFAFCASAIWAWWRLAIREARAKHA